MQCIRSLAKAALIDNGAEVFKLPEVHAVRLVFRQRIGDEPVIDSAGINEHVTA